MSERIGAVILAGGRSSRMGEDKAALLLDGQTLLQRTILTVSQLTTSVTVVGSPPPESATANCRIIPDNYPGEGPLGGILTGFSCSGERMRLVLACDMPLLSCELLELLISSFDGVSDAVVPQRGDYLEGLCALYSKSAVNKLQGFFDSGGRSIHRGLKQLNVQVISEEVWRDAADTPDVMSSANTPNEFERLKQIFVKTRL